MGDVEKNGDIKTTYSHEKVDQDKTEAGEEKPDTPSSENSKDEKNAIAKLVAVFLTFCIIGAFSYGSGIIHKILLERYNASVGLTSWAGALLSALMMMPAPLSSTIVNMYSCRVAIMLGGLCYTVGFVASVFAPNIFMAIFTVGIVAGLGSGLTCTAALMVIAFNFKTRLPVMYGIATSGIGAGLTAFAPLFQYTHARFGHAGFFLILAGLSMTIFILGAICSPSKLEMAVKKQRETTHATKTSGLSVLKNKGIVCLCVSFFSFGFGLYTINLHLPKYMTLQGFSHAQAAQVLSLMGGVSVIGRVTTGLLSNLGIMNVIFLFANSMFVVAIITYVYPLLSSTFAGQIVFATVVGLFYPTCFVLITPCTKRFVELVNVSTAVGLQFLFGGTGAIVGPVFAGFLVDQGATYEHSLYIGAGFLILSGVSISITAWLPDLDRNKPPVIIEMKDCGNKALDIEPLPKKEVS